MESPLAIGSSNVLCRLRSTRRGPVRRHWHDALALRSRRDLDWQYLPRRARHGPRRVLSLLLDAQSNDLPVPAKVIDDLYRRITTS